MRDKFWNYKMTFFYGSKEPRLHKSVVFLNKFVIKYLY